MVDDPYTRYRQDDLRGRTIDTLIGIGKGIIADGHVNQSEAESLLTFLRENDEAYLDHPMTNGLLDRVTEMLQDGVLDNEESQELHDLLAKISGGISRWGELSKPATLPLDDPAPALVFEGRSFLFTGTFMYGARTACHRITQAQGGTVHKAVTRRLDYLVIGSYATVAWKHQSFGTKIEKAMDYRDGGKSGLAIIAEEHWERCLTAEKSN